MRFPVLVRFLPLLAGAAVAAACTTTNPNNSFIAPPPSTTAASGPLTLSQGATTQALATSNGLGASITIPGGTGSVAVTGGTTPPAGATSVNPAAFARKTQTSATSPLVYYITITSTAGATLNGLPAVALTLPAPAVGTYNEAQFTSGAWGNINTVPPALNASSTAVQFVNTSTPVTIPASGAIYLAFYQGTFPNPTPMPVATAVQVLADPSFESGVAAPYGSAISSTGWTQCTVGKPSSGATPSPALSTFTPIPSTTPGAIILASGTSWPAPTSAKAGVQTTVPVTTGNYAAVFGGIFMNFNQEDFAYNGLCQLVTIPKNPTMTLQVWESGDDGKSDIDFVVDVLDTNGVYLGQLIEDVNPETSSSPGDMQYRSLGITTALTPFVGQKVQLFVGLWVHDSGSGSKFGGTYFVDDVLLNGIVQ